MSLKVDCLAGLFHHHMMTTSMHTHAYCFPSYESGTKTGLCMITLCRKDLDLYFKLKYNK